MKRAGSENSKVRAKGSALGFLTPFTVIVTLVVSAVFLSTTLAWYILNKEAGGADTVVSAPGGTFEIGAVTNAGGTARQVGVESDILNTISSLGSRDYSRNDLATAADVNGVICALETDSGSPMRPGATGTLRLRIIPKQDGCLFYAQISITGLKKLIDMTDEDNPVITYELLDYSKTTPDEGKEISERQVLDLLDGHLIFFLDSGRTRILDMSREIEIRGASDSSKEYIVTLYWEWPRTYDVHEAYVGSDASWQSAHPVSHVLYNANGDDEMGYNNADQVIGEWVSHVLVEADVASVSINPAATPQYVTAAAIS